nr:hypothetical protein [Prevotella sp. oral taxon 472]
MMHDYINRRVICVLDGCSMLSGMLFQMIWNTVPTYLEQESILAVRKCFVIKRCLRAYLACLKR